LVTAPCLQLLANQTGFLVIGALSLAGADVRPVLNLFAKVHFFPKYLRTIGVWLGFIKQWRTLLIGHRLRHFL
jgi:hypothetical protein